MTFKYSVVKIKNQLREGFSFYKNIEREGVSLWKRRFNVSSQQLRGQAWDISRAWNRALHVFWYNMTKLARLKWLNNRFWSCVRGAPCQGVCERRGRFNILRVPVRKVCFDFIRQRGISSTLFR